MVLRGNKNGDTLEFPSEPITDNNEACSVFNKNNVSNRKYAHTFIVFLNFKNKHNTQLAIIFYYSHSLIKSLFFQFYANSATPQRQCRLYCGT